MRKSRYSDEQIAAALRQAEAGTPIADITRKLGISEATFYAWRKRFGQLEPADVKRLRALEAENSRLKKVLAEKVMDIEILKEVNAKKW